MAQGADQIEIYLETGDKRTFAVALNWPGWCRSGRDEASALQTLYDYGPRYAQVFQSTPLEFHAPSSVLDFEIVELLTGNATTDFGAPDVSLSRDTEPVDQTELQRWQTILEACWQKFDAVVEAASGKTLSKGPRGGGRDLKKIVEHVRDVDIGYLKSLGGNVKLNKEDEPQQALISIRQAILTTIVAAVNGEIPTHGPRGGLRWTPRYFVRRLAWHELDHVWEIEDRAG